MCKDITMDIFWFRIPPNWWEGDLSFFPRSSA